MTEVQYGTQVNAPVDMELEFTSRSRSPTEKLPADVNAASDLFTQQRWYSNLAIPSPIIYGVHLVGALVFGTLSLVFGIQILASDISKNPAPFWELFPEFLVMAITLIVTFLVQFGQQPAFWKHRAQQMVNEGYFDSSSRTNGKRRLVLEIGCNEGKTSTAFAKAIIDRQRDIGNLTAPHASLPIFIGYDRWSPWSRIPNTPGCFLSTLLHAGVPRECIIANRMDMTSQETKTQLPYPSGSISLVICNLGLSELVRDPISRGKLFQELARVLEPGGRTVMVESRGGGKWDRRHLWESPVASYKRILLEEMGWPGENVVTRWDLGVCYLVGIKPTGTQETV